MSLEYCPCCGEPSCVLSDGHIERCKSFVNKQKELDETLALLPPDALDEVIKVLQFGLTKHPKNDWDTVSTDRHFYHCTEHIKEAYGFDQSYNFTAKDAESGLHHLAHAICRLLFALELVIRREAKNGS